MDALQRVDDAYIGLVDRVGSYYARYVETMWSVVVLHTKSVVGDELWSTHMCEFAPEYARQSLFEQELSRIHLREDGINARVALDELHEDLEYRFHTELLAQHGMTVKMAEQLAYWSRHRLERHAALRKHLRYCIDSAQFHACDAAAKLERRFDSAPEATRVALTLMEHTYPRVVPL